jgi:hypothetical protein
MKRVRRKRGKTESHQDRKKKFDDLLLEEKDIKIIEKEVKTVNHPYKESFKVPDLHHDQIHEEEKHE